MKAAPVDEKKTELLNEFFEELKFDSRTKLYVLKANEFNAFALPDNSIFVFDKVFKDVNSYTELSALLSHEYSHIKNRHGMKEMAQAITWQLVGTILTGGDNKDDFIQQSNKFLTLKHSRDFETQADLDGLKLLKEQHIDQFGMVDLLQLISKLPEEKQIEKIPTYLSTHPATDERLDKIQEALTSFEKAIEIESKQQDRYKI